MRIALLCLGVGSVVISVIAGGEIEGDVPFGYFLVSASLIIAGAFWQDQSREKRYFEALPRVAAFLAENPMKIEDLLLELQRKYPVSEFDPIHSESVGWMIRSGLLCIQDGLVVLSEELCCSSPRGPARWEGDRGQEETD